MITLGGVIALLPLGRFFQALGPHSKISGGEVAGTHVRGICQRLLPPLQLTVFVHSGV